ncbi:hypothetical protein ABPG73_008120 [Tetrahymena malaccensis]
MLEEAIKQYYRLSELNAAYYLPFNILDLAYVIKKYSESKHQVKFEIYLIQSQMLRNLQQFKCTLLKERQVVFNILGVAYLEQDMIDYDIKQYQRCKRNHKFYMDFVNLSEALGIKEILDENQAKKMSTQQIYLQKQQVQNQVLSVEENIINFLSANGCKFLQLIGQHGQGKVILAYSNYYQSNVAIKIFDNHEEFELEKSNLSKLKGEKYIIQMISHLQNTEMSALVLDLQYCNQQNFKLSTSPILNSTYKINQVDTFSMGTLILVVFLNNTLSPLQVYQLKFEQLQKVVPEIINHPNYEFIHEIISNMIQIDQNQRLYPVQLIQKFNSLYQIDKNCLNTLILPKKQSYDQVNITQTQLNINQNFESNHLDQLKDQSQKNQKFFNEYENQQEPVLNQNFQSNPIDQPYYYQSQKNFELFNQLEKKQKLSLPKQKFMLLLKILVIVFLQYWTSVITKEFKELDLPSQNFKSNLIDQLYFQESQQCVNPDQQKFTSDNVNDLFSQFLEKLFTKQWNQAYRFILICSQKQPNNSLFLFNLGYTQFELNLFSEAIQSCQRYIELKPNDYLAFQVLGLAYERKGMLDEAIQSIQRSIELNPNDFQSFDNLGIFYRKKGMLDEAIKSHQRSIELNPNNYEAFNYLGVAYQKKDKLDEAIKSFKRCIQLNPNNYEAFNYLGVAYQKKDKLDEAIKSFKRCIQLNPNYYQAFVNLGVAYENKGMLDEAIKSFQRCIELNPNHYEAFHYLGVVYDSKGMLDEAIKSQQRCIELNPNYYEAFHRLGKAYSEIGMLDQSIESFQRCIKLEPNFYQAYNNLGVTYREKGMLDEEIKSYLRCIELNPDSYQAFYNLGQAYDKKGMLDQVIKSYERCIELNPNYYQAFNNLGIAYKEKGMLDEAIKSYQRCIELNPKDYKALHNLAQAYYSKGMQDEMIKTCERCIELNPNDYKAFKYLGVAFQRKRMVDKAIELYQRCLEINPKDRICQKKKNSYQWNQAYELILIICQKKIPNYSEFWFYLGYTQDQINLLSEAIKSYQRCIQLNPNSYRAFGNLGKAYEDKGMLDEAINSFKRCIELNPNFNKAFNNLSVAYERKDMLDEAIKSFQRCIELNHNYYEAFNNQGVVYQRKGMPLNLFKAAYNQILSINIAREIQNMWRSSQNKAKFNMYLYIQISFQKCQIQQAPKAESKQYILNNFSFNISERDDQASWNSTFTQISQVPRVKSISQTKDGVPI